MAENEYKDLKTVDDENNERWFEGMPRQDVNNSARGDLGMTARYYTDTRGVLVSTGSGGDYTVTISSQFTDLFDGLPVKFITNHAATGACTLTIQAPNPLTQKDLVANDGSAIVDEQITAGMILDVVYVLADDHFKITQIVPAGKGKVGLSNLADGSPGGLITYDTDGTPIEVVGTSNQIPHIDPDTGLVAWRDIVANEIKTYDLTITEDLETGTFDLSPELTAAPTNVDVYAECVDDSDTATHGYQIGERVAMPNNGQTYNEQPGLFYWPRSGFYWSLSTDGLTVSWWAGFRGLVFIPRKNQTINFNPEWSHWKFVFVAVREVGEDQISSPTSGEPRHTIRDENDVDYADQPTLKFINLDVSDDAANNQTIVDASRKAEQSDLTAHTGDSSLHSLAGLGGIGTVQGSGQGTSLVFGKSGTVVTMNDIAPGSNITFDTGTSGLITINSTTDTGASGHIIKDEGGPELPQRTYLNFVGPYIEATDDSANDATNITLQISTGDYNNWTDAYTHSVTSGNPHSTLHAQLPDAGTNTHAQIDTHIADTDIHVTAVDQSNWNTHIADLDIHVTTSDKTNWNNKADVSYVDTSVAPKLENLTDAGASGISLQDGKSGSPALGRVKNLAGGTDISVAEASGVVTVSYTGAGGGTTKIPDWQTATSYAVDDVFIVSGSSFTPADSAASYLFRALLAHTSSTVQADIDASRIKLIGPLAELYADTIDEFTTDAGVTIDGVLIKDGQVDGRTVSTDGAKLDGIEAGAKAGDVVGPAGGTAASMVAVYSDTTGKEIEASDASIVSDAGLKAELFQIAATAVNTTAGFQTSTDTPGSSYGYGAYVIEGINGTVGNKFYMMGDVTGADMTTSLISVVAGGGILTNTLTIEANGGVTGNVVELLTDGAKRLTISETIIDFTLPGDFGANVVSGGDPTAAQHFVTRAYGDANYGGAGTDITVTETPTGVDIDSSTGTGDTIALGTGTNAGAISPAQTNKLAGIADGAQVGTVTQVNTGTGLTGGPITTAGTVNLENTAVTPGSYTNADITVDAQGRLTAAASGSSGSAPIMSFPGVGMATGAGRAAQIYDGDEMVSSFALTEIALFNATLNIDTATPHKAVLKCSCLAGVVTGVCQFQIRVWNKATGASDTANFQTASLSGDVTVSGTDKEIFEVSITITDWAGAVEGDQVQFEIQRIAAAGTEIIGDARVRSWRVEPA